MAARGRSAGAYEDTDGVSGANTGAREARQSETDMA